MKKTKRAARIGALTLAVLCFALCAVPALAAGSTGSIRLRAGLDMDDRPQPLGGDTYSLAQIASAAGTEPVTYHWAEGFQEYACDVTALTDSQRMALAGTLARLAAENGLYTRSAETGEDGETVFSELDAGLYLLARTAAAPENEAYTCAPLIIELPCLEGDTWVYDVAVTMKFEAPTEPEQPPAPTPEAAPPSEKLAQTGQLNWPIPFLAGGGVCLFVAGWALLREAKDEKSKKTNT